jgi:hypothetical protein
MESLTTGPELENNQGQTAKWPAVCSESVHAIAKGMTPS